MNPVDHPHGGGEGKTAGGRHPVSRTGQSAKGLKTRDNKRTDKFILRIWSDLIKRSKITQIDSKTRLQEYSLKKFKSLPIYRLISNTGPRHKPKFKIGVRLKNSKFVEAKGNSKKSAEQAAAKEFLKNMKSYDLG